MRNIRARELDAADGIIGLQTEILHKMGEYDGIVIVGRDGVIVVIRLDGLVPVLELDVVRIHVVLVEPEVERGIFNFVHGDDGFRVQFVLVAGRKRKSRYHRGQ